jgi:type IV pilus assembly protein PilW
MKTPALPRAGRRASGFTLVEVLVALALGVLVLLALTILFARNTGNHSQLEATTRQLENARFALDALAEDVMHAGYYSEFNPDTLADPPNWTTPDPCAVGVAVADTGWDTAATPVSIPAPVQGLAAGSGEVCLGSRRGGTEAVVLRHADTGGPITMAQGNATNLYLQVARCQFDVARLRAAPVPASGAALTFNLRQPDCATVNDRLRRLAQRTYFVATCNDCGGSGDGIPTLKRVEMIDGALRTVSIAEGVENLQIEYGLDTDGDGQPDNFVTVAGVTGVGANTWQNVVALRLHLLTRATQTTPGYTDTRTYQVGPAVAVAQPNDGFKRTLFTSTVRLHNVAGRRE